jgi:hypothetical protein
LLAEFLRTLRLVPDVRVFELAGDFLEPLFLQIVLKETPSRRQHAPRDLSGFASAA